MPTVIIAGIVKSYPTASLKCALRMVDEDLGKLIDRYRTGQMLKSFNYVSHGDQWCKSLSNRRVIGQQTVQFVSMPDLDFTESPIA
ncbi:hypothetical protein D2E64_20575 [Mycobacteroides abscessus]|nr:hypothetical protein S7W_03562 [Mycobacteroides abscessus M94]OLT92624.1 hypothetical protein BKG58_05750 [Mycobacteroides abscessus subsp. abscessus]PVA33827.1 hypothetical protein DDJ98_13245 [Mycobacteroides abscessus]RIR02845.1 hypothetical protein D2E35_00160 [Mycobacteroides abscessus]RIR37365.1 hypothetical protein D2E36_20115 [Mycobacteroides abscessus]